MNPIEAIEAIEAIKISWREFEECPFPHHSRTKDMTVDLALVDGDIAGCVQTFVEDGTLSDEHIKALRRCIGGLLDLRARCTADDAVQKLYIAQLLAMAKQVLDAVNA